MVSILHKFGEKAKIIGGGTDIYGLANRGLLSHVDALVDISRLALSNVKTSDRYLRIGASTTLSELSTSPSLKEASLGAIGDALTQTRPIQVKNAATVAGCICSGLPFFDLPIALLALDASVRVYGRNGYRKIPLEKFFLGYFSVDLKRGEFVTEIDVPKHSLPAGSAFQKFAITGDDWAIVNAAASLSVSSNGRCKSARIVIGGAVGPTPVRVTRAEKLLLGETPATETFRKASEEAAREIQPDTDIRASAEYRKKLCKVIVERSLKQAYSRVKMRTR